MRSLCVGREPDSLVQTYDGMNEAKGEVIGYPVDNEVAREVVFVVPDLGGMREGLFDRSAEYNPNLA